MNKPELYSASNTIQMTVSILNLKEYTNKIKWNKSEDTVIDIGCGDGSVTVHVKNITPSTYKKFVACDVSNEMINFAKKRYMDEDILFKVMDIAGEVPEDMKGAFNHVFSFYTLHWVKDQEAAFRNIYDLMSNDGDCFMTFIGASDLYRAYAALAHHPKWKSYLKDLNSKFKGPYSDVKNPEKKVEELMTKGGFRNTEVKLKLNENSYDSVQALKNFIQSLEPFNMANEVFDEFIKDFITVSQENGMLRVENNENIGKTYFINDYVLVIYATK